ncbi:MAG: hypothetical protein RUMPE_00203 [Eubacteriales bacterium SKADARSKE-1]|nr:hypothetical protein [Eubacteriales bacterium SKADARSKE-1]
MKIKLGHPTLIKIYPNRESFSEGIKSELKWGEAPDWLTTACGENIILLLSSKTEIYKYHKSNAIHEFVNIILRKLRSDNVILWSLWEGVARYEVGKIFPENNQNYTLKKEHLPNSIEDMFSWTLNDGVKVYSCGLSLVAFIVENYGYDKFIELYKKDYSNNDFDYETREIYEKWIVKVR